MNRYETETKGDLVNTAPLFASVWLALFYTLRENYHNRRLVDNAETDHSQSLNNK